MFFLNLPKKYMKPTSKFRLQNNSYITFGCIKNYLFLLINIFKHMTYLHKYYLHQQIQLNYI
jgi:hypothetical protein